jgi:hypothetical protein
VFRVLEVRLTMVVATESRQASKPAQERPGAAFAVRRRTQDLRRFVRKGLVVVRRVRAKLRVIIETAARVGSSARERQSSREPYIASARLVRNVEAAVRRGPARVALALKHLLLKTTASRAPAAGIEAITFEVVSGLHGGVLLMLENGDYGIGSTAEADIVLRDPGVKPGHAVLAVRRGSVSLEASGGDVTVGRQTMSQGHGCRLKLPLEMSLGRAQLRLCYVQSPRAAFGERFRLATAGAAACATIAVGLLMLAPGRHEASGANAVTAATTVRVVSSASDIDVGSLAPARVKADPGANRVEPDHRPQSVRQIDEALRELAKQINAANIHTLRVSIIDGHLAVDGSLSRRDSSAWSIIQHWFDETYHGRLLLTTNFVATEGRTKPLLQLQAVWFGERPYVVTAEGAHFYQGVTLDNGWVIRNIDGERILLAKDGETVALTYR